MAVGLWTRVRSMLGVLLPEPTPRPPGRGERWWTRPRAPVFRVDPVASHMPDGRTVRLLLTFRQTAGHDVEASLRARWRGAGVEMPFVAPLIDIREHTYQMKSTIADPARSDDADVPAEHAAFELSFEWDGGERHCLWVWPLIQERDGRWALAATAANTETPSRQW